METESDTADGPFPDWLAELGRRAVAEAYGRPGEAAGSRPDTALGAISPRGL